MLTTFEGIIELSEDTTDAEWRQILGVCGDWNEGANSEEARRRVTKILVIWI